MFECQFFAKLCFFLSSEGSSNSVVKGGNEREKERGEREEKKKIGKRKKKKF